MNRDFLSNGMHRRHGTATQPLHAQSGTSNGSEGKDLDPSRKGRKFSIQLVNQTAVVGSISFSWRHLFLLLIVTVCVLESRGPAGPSLEGKRRAGRPRQIRFLYGNTGRPEVSTTRRINTDSWSEDESYDEEPIFLSRSDRMFNAEYLYTHSDGCKPVYDWQVQFYPSCNNFHEFRLDDLAYLNSGGSRSAFEISDSGGRGKPIVLKVMKYKKDLSDTSYGVPKFFEQQRLDAIIMERLTRSPFIPTSYGFCGISSFMEYSDGGNLHDLVKAARLDGGGNEYLAPLDRLKIGYQLAGGLADLHTIDGEDKMPGFAHNDLCCHQFLFIDGVFKLNDFNHGEIITADENKKQCLQRCNMKYYKMRSLEDFQYEVTGEKFKSDKADVYMLGNLLYYILTDKWLFEGISRQAAMEKIRNGERSPIPGAIEESEEPAFVALKKSVQLCWTHNSAERPNARKVASYLLEELKKINGKGELDVRVKLPPRDPTQKFTDSDWRKHN